VLALSAEMASCRADTIAAGHLPPGPV